MYQVNEKKLDNLLLEGTSLLSRLQHLPNIPSSEVTHFGDALLSVQTEVHKQVKVTDIGFGSQRLDT